MTETSTPPLFEQHLARAEALSFFATAINGTGCAGEIQWRQALGSPQPYVRAAAVAAIDAEEARRQALDAGRLPERASLDPQAPDEAGDFVRAELAADAQRAAAYRRSPEAQYDLLVEIRDLLKAGRA
jgi:hypothetical protein